MLAHYQTVHNYNFVITNRIPDLQEPKKKAEKTKLLKNNNILTKK